MLETLPQDPQDWTFPQIKDHPLIFFSRMPPNEQLFVLVGMKEPEKREFLSRWHEWAHAGQRPVGDDWRIWLIMAGRGFGKTRAGSEWVSELARGDGTRRFALIGATIDDVRNVMIEGESGLIAVARKEEKVTYNSGKGEVTFPSGALAHVYSAEAYEKLRGPEHSFAWCDELAKWNYPEKAWDNMILGLRLGENPRVLVTTTPRPIPLLRRILSQAGTILRGGATADNYNLPSSFIAMVQAQYGGTRLGRQELEGELIAEIAGALWTRDMIEQSRTADIPEMRRIVIAVDPPITAGGDACGIIAAGLGEDGCAYVLADHSVSGLSPEGWALAVAGAAQAWNADRVIAEGNQGGEMVESTLRAANRSMNVKRVMARHGKSARAEPVAALFESGRARFAGSFRELEDELCGMIIGGGYEGPGRSPDRADALVWAMHELMLAGGDGRVRVRQL